jgi:hypothetical protein
MVSNVEAICIDDFMKNCARDTAIALDIRFNQSLRETKIYRGLLFER